MVTIPAHRHTTRLLLRTIVLACAMLLLSACAEEQEPYPNIITEFADIHSDAQGLLVQMTTDNGKNYLISNTNIKPHRPDTTYRAIVGYVPETESTPLKAHIYTLTGAQILSDSTTCLQHDPTGIESMWQQGKYINMQLTAKTQGGTHHWGYAIDSVQHVGQEGRTHAHHHLSIHHNQGQDPISYSQTYYCSILPSSIPHLQPTDTITIAVHTFKGTKKWMFIQ